MAHEAKASEVIITMYARFRCLLMLGGGGGAEARDARTSFVFVTYFVAKPFLYNVLTYFVGAVIALNVGGQLHL